MKVTDGDFLIVEAEKILRLVQVFDGKWRLRDKQSINLEDFNNKVPVDDKTVVANLGPNPKPGKAYGVGCEPILKHVHLDLIGDVFFFRHMKKLERKALLKSYSKAAKLFNDLDVWPYKTFVSYIMPYRKSSMYAGTYHWYKTETRKDELTLFTDDYNNKDRTLYVFAHELAHAVWFNRLDDDLRCDWIEAYNENLDKMKFGSNKLVDIRKTLKDAGSIAVYKKMCDPEDKEVLGEILRFIARVHKLHPSNINALIASGRSIKSIWPTDPVELSKKNVLITEYANESPEEFFAEAMALHLTGTKMPKSIRSLIDATLKRAKHLDNPYEAKRVEKKKKSDE